MKKFIGFIGRINEKVLSLSDAFEDYLNDNYFPGAVDELDEDTVQFEYQNFLNNYSK